MTKTQITTTVLLLAGAMLNVDSASTIGESECHPQAMAQCTDPLKVVTDNKDLGFATSKHELGKMCPKLMDGLRCIDNFTFRCLNREHRAYFNTLYAGTTQVIVDLCTEGRYQMDYLRHAPCMREVQSGYEQCASDYQLRIKTLNKQSAKSETSVRGEGEINEAEDEKNVQLLCCSFQRYLYCSEKVVNSTCGPETARFTKSFLDRMSGPLIQGHCQANERESCDNGNQLSQSDDDFYPSSAQHHFSSSPPLMYLNMWVLLSSSIILRYILNLS